MWILGSAIPHQRCVYTLSSAAHDPQVIARTLQCSVKSRHMTVMWKHLIVTVR
jgi:hypothetical protein